MPVIPQILQTSIEKEIDQNQTESPILKSGSDQPVIPKKKNPAENNNHDQETNNDISSIQKM